MKTDTESYYIALEMFTGNEKALSDFSLLEYPSKKEAFDKLVEFVSRLGPNVAGGTVFNDSGEKLYTYGTMMGCNGWQE